MRDYKKIFNVIIIILNLMLFTPASYANKNLIDVNVAVLETFSPTDAEDSLRYRTAYLNTLFSSVASNQARLHQCGYKMQIFPYFFNGNNPLDVINQVKKINENTIWFVIGPMRSNDFLLAAKFLSNTPMVSPLANSDNIFPFEDKPIFIMLPNVASMAKTTVSVINTNNYGKTYATFLDAVCVQCQEFSESFDRYANKKLSKEFQLNGFSDSPDLSKLKKLLKKNPVDFLLLPNHSKFSGYTIMHLHNQFPHLKFVGGDNWGSGEWSYLSWYNIPKDVIGFSVRPVENNDLLSRLYQINLPPFFYNNTKLTQPAVAINLSILINQLTNNLCAISPENSKAYQKFLLNQKQNYFSVKFPLGVYSFDNGKLILTKILS